MTSAEFWRSVRETRPLLEQLELLRAPMRFHRQPSGEFRAAATAGLEPYGVVFRTGLEHQDYCFLLEDYSYFQLFHFEDRASGFAVRYAFYPNPFPYIPFEDFLDDLGLSGSDPEAFEFYQQYLSELSGADGFGQFRYEVDFDGHRPLRHACAHLHIGHQTSIRIGVDKVLSPKAFVLFMAKCHFPEAWSKSDEQAGIPNVLDRTLQAEKSACALLPAVRFGRLEQGEFFLT